MFFLPCLRQRHKVRFLLAFRFLVRVDDHLFPFVEVEFRIDLGQFFCDFLYLALVFKRFFQFFFRNGEVGTQLFEFCGKAHTLFGKVL